MMTQFSSPLYEYNVPRNIALLDTNVIVAYFDSSDQFHDQAKLFVDEYDDYALGVTSPVIVEACAMLTRRAGGNTAVKCLNWMLTPGKLFIFTWTHSGLSMPTILWGHRDIMGKYIVDYVDSHLMEFADAVTRTLDLRPHMPIATFDTRDFMRCALKGRHYSLFDVRDLLLTEFS